MASLNQTPSKEEKETPPPRRSSGRENGEGKRSVDFAHDYFKANDPAESKLIDALEENTDIFSSSIKPRPARGHRRKASKLQQLVKQISNRQHLTLDEPDEQEQQQRTNFNIDSQPQSGANIYNSLSQSHPNLSGEIPRGSFIRKRASCIATATASDSHSRRRSSSMRRVSLPARDLGVPTSAFLSTLSEKLDDDATTMEEEEEEEAVPDDQAGNSPAKSPRARHRRLRTTTDALYDPHAQHLEALFQIGPKDTYEDIAVFNDRRAEANRSALSTAFSDLSEEDEAEEDRDPDIEGGANSSSPLIRRRRQTHPQLGVVKRAYAYLLALLSIMGPGDIWNGVVHFLLYRCLLLMVPVLSVAAILFYGFGNPNFHFLPSKAHMSWWLIFLVRLCLCASLAEATQYMLEIITTRTSIIVRAAGPFVALIAMQSLGWPFLLSSWGAWSMVLMRGGHPFSKNWLWFLGIKMFSAEHNPDGGVLESDVLTRILVAFIFVGAATAAKRTIVALYLSRRMLQYYRKQLRELLADIKILMEIAELSAETETEQFSRLLNEEATSQNEPISGGSSLPRGSSISDLTLTTLKATATKIMAEKIPTFNTPLKTPAILGKASDDDEDESILSDEDDEATMEVHAATPSSRRSAISKRSFPQRRQNSSLTEPDRLQKGPVQWRELKSQVTPKATGAEALSSSPIEMAASEGEVRRSHHSTRSVSSKGLDKLVPLMERWEEPETKSKKSLPSLFDILQFRKAMEFMENPYPFSSAFGMARTRKECIRSSARVYRRLLRFTPGASVLQFDVIGALAYDDGGDLDEKHAQSLLKLFQPDKDELLSQLSFLQSVDHVYKQLRFLRASILNSSKIDSVLEDVFDVLFYGMLAILVMTLLGLNPWPLLVSFSTLMVSFAFSFGPSCAKYIEGTLMIAVRRPYSIGDRITIISGESLAQPSSSADTWLVEDISLSTTTLRFAATNEVSTVNNAAIANSRIVNGARSMKAIVTITVKFDMHTTQEQIDVFRIRVENYLIDRPEIWAGLVHFRSDEVDHNEGYSSYLLRVQHLKSWQDMPPIMVNRGELVGFCNKVAMDLNIAWLSSHHRVRIMEVPTVITAQEDNEGYQKEPRPKEEPFMRFLKAETG